MSITIDFAFNATESLAAVGDTVSKVLGATLLPYEGNPDDLFARFLGLELSLTDVGGLEDDGSVDFTNFDYLLATRTPAPDGPLRLYQLEATALAAMSLLVRGGVTKGILAYDGQILLARYSVVEDVVYDAVSGGPVDLPQHFIDLHKRLRR